MVKIRLRRIGSKGRPFYRVVVAPSAAGRNGRFVETIGTYDPIAQPKHVEINEERALHWLMEGAQPTETTAYLLNKVGILPKFFEQRPQARKQFGFLDKTTAAISVASAVEAPGATAVEAPAPEPVAQSEAAATEPEATEPEATEPEATPEPVAEESAAPSAEAVDAAPADETGEGA
jgi:small subunit ribosomal protein S16